MSQSVSDTTSNENFPALMRPFLLGDLRLSNSIAMAPLTRCQADEALVPTEAMADYYARRADVGLIISEATIVSPNGQGYPNTPGIYSKAQVEGWRRVVDAVHRKGGRIFLQLWHVGRVSHSSMLDGSLPVAPSAIGIKGRIPRSGDLAYETPRALRTEEISEYVEFFASGAANAMDAGFDGVEIHGANGYLIDQFLHACSNVREDAYGGSPENMARFALEVVDAILARVSSKRVGIRLSPAGHYNDIETQAVDAEAAKYLLKQLEERSIAYVHTGITDDSVEYPVLGGKATEFLRAHYRGTLMGCGGYTAEAADVELREGRMDMIAIGRPFIANPDLISLLKSGGETKPFDESMLETLY